MSEKFDMMNAIEKRRMAEQIAGHLNDFSTRLVHTRISKQNSDVIRAGLSAALANAGVKDFEVEIDTNYDGNAVIKCKLPVPLNSIVMDVLLEKEDWREWMMPLVNLVKEAGGE